jgi:hypothetical protein
VPRDRFLVAGRAWQSCRAGDADSETFMVDPSLDLDTTRSWPYLQHNLIHDLAALNKTEMLLWDAWGLADERSTDQHDLARAYRIRDGRRTHDGPTSGGHLASAPARCLTRLLGAQARPDLLN